jgi:hypothetical protein
MGNTTEDVLDDDQLRVLRVCTGYPWYRSSQDVKENRRDALGRQGDIGS